MKNERTNWDEIYMKICELIADRTTCIYVKTGAIIVNPINHNIIGIGYNGPSRGDYHCNEVGCARFVNGIKVEHGDLCRGAHGEINAIINAGSDLKGMTMYSIYTPCNNCAKHIVNSGIKQFCYNKKYGENEYSERVLNYLSRLGVEVKEIKLNQT